MLDLKHVYGTDVLVLRSCYHHDGSDLLSIAGDGSVQIIQCVRRLISPATGDWYLNILSVVSQTDTSIRPLAYFAVGLRVTAIAWSPRSVSPAASDEWFLE